MSKVAAKAREWIGKEFNPGVREQCMAFVRHVLRQAKHPLANSVTKEPVDGLWTGINLASSLAGRDLGQLVVRPEHLKPGAILFWNDTYEGDWGPNTITHVGIYTGHNQNGDQVFVHRPTMAKPVLEERLSGYWLRQFRCALILEEAEGEPVSKPPVERRWKFAAHSGRQSIIHNGQEQPAAELVLNAHSGRFQVVLGGKVIEPKFVKMEIVY